MFECDSSQQFSTKKMSIEYYDCCIVLCTFHSDLTLYIVACVAFVNHINNGTNIFTLFVLRLFQFRLFSHTSESFINHTCPCVLACESLLFKVLIHFLYVKDTRLVTDSIQQNSHPQERYKCYHGYCFYKLSQLHIATTVIGILIINSIGTIVVLMQLHYVMNGHNAVMKKIARIVMQQKHFTAETIGAYQTIYNVMDMMIVGMVPMNGSVRVVKLGSTNTNTIFRQEFVGSMH